MMFLIELHSILAPGANKAVVVSARDQVEVLKGARESFGGMYRVGVIRQVTNSQHAKDMAAILRLPLEVEEAEPQIPKLSVAVPVAVTPVPAENVDTPGDEPEEVNTLSLEDF